MLGLGRDILRLVSTGVTGGGGGPAPPPYTPPMDAYPADIAYSVRLVNGTYSGPCIEAYRVSDGATQDIGFDSFGRVSATELAAFSSGSVLEVQTWYDQMPGANHAVATVNTTTGTLTRAIVYDGSSIVTDGIEPALDFVNPVDFPTLRFSNIGVASGYESFQVTNAATSNSGVPLYVTSTGYNFNHHQPISYPNGNVYDGFGSNARPAFLGIGYPNMYMQHVYNTTTGPKNVRINNTLVGTASAAANVGSLSHYISAMARTQVGDNPAGRYRGYIKELFIYKAIQTSGMRDALTSNINSFYQIGNFPDYTSGFLADYPDAAAAYSVRQLSNTAIKCMRVRRAVAPFDEQDIGFTAGGDLDEAAIVAFGGSDVLVVSAWYDQSGQSNHATQINPNNQPQIYNGTAVITENGKPAIDFQTSRKVLSAGSVLDVSSRDIYQWSVYSLQTGAFWTPIINGPLYSSTNQNTYQPRLYVQRTSSQPFGNSATALNIDQQYLRHDYADTSNARTFLDGDSSPVIDLVDNNSDWSTGVLEIGTIGTTPDTYQKVSEVLLWQTGAGTVPSNRTGIETNVNDYYEVFVNDEAATSGFLFDYPNAAVAYSVRQLNNNAEFAMQVERSDGRVKNIGFDSNGDLDTQAIIDFAGPGSATVRFWYDQSGEQNHARSVSQPQVYNGTAVITENGKPAVEFTSDLFNVTYPFATTGSGLQDIYISSVARFTDTTTEGNVYGLVSGSIELALGFNRNATSIWGTRDKTGLANHFVGGTYDQSQSLFTQSLSGTTYSAYRNGNAASGGYTGKGTGGNAIGTNGQTTAFFHIGTIQEVIFWDADRSGDRTNIETNTMTYYGIP